MDKNGRMNGKMHKWMNDEWMNGKRHIMTGSIDQSHVSLLKKKQSSNKIREWNIYWMHIDIICMSVCSVPSPASFHVRGWLELTRYIIFREDKGVYLSWSQDKLDPHSPRGPIFI